MFRGGLTQMQPAAGSAATARPGTAVVNPTAKAVNNWFERDPEVGT